ncbi:MAG: hypothetical protein KGL39_30845 [Patescibacteria group bacterium]|nr:hypothetical protein [Patescibacteria group bacterium]
MSRSLILVAANKGGVGKTTTARLLVDYLQADQNRMPVFDGQAPGGSLRRFYPAAELSALDTTAGRMRLLDSLGDRPTLADLPAGLLSETLQFFHDVGFLDDVRKGTATLSVVHVIGPSVDSLGEAAEIAARLAEGGDHYLVKNCVTDERFEWSVGAHGQALARIAPKGMAEIAHLDGTAREAADVAGGTFTAFIVDEGRSYVLRRLVQKWWRDAFSSFDGAGFRAMAVG